MKFFLILNQNSKTRLITILIALCDIIGGLITLLTLGYVGHTTMSLLFLKSKKNKLQ